MARATAAEHDGAPLLKGTLQLNLQFETPIGDTTPRGSAHLETDPDHPLSVDISQNKQKGLETERKIFLQGQEDLRYLINY